MLYAKAAPTLKTKKAPKKVFSESFRSIFFFFWREIKTVIIICLLKYGLYTSCLIFESKLLQKHSNNKKNLI